MQEAIDDNYLCPSFSSFGYLAEIAAKISDEFQEATEENASDCFDGDNSEELDFEFSTMELIYGGQTEFQSIFPVFNRDLLLNVNNESSSSDAVDSEIRIPLKSFFLEELESTTASASASEASSDVDELEILPPGTYCVWKPKISNPSPGKCKKSKSTGSAPKRWPKLRDLLRRSNSDGKDTSFVFLTPKKSIKSETTNLGEVVKAAGKSKQLKGSGTGGESPVAAYIRNRAANQVDKNRRKSYLPYRQDLIGFFASVNGLTNGLSRSYRPF